jgi:thiosulfate reductase cytochrome b subunit
VRRLPADRPLTGGRLLVHRHGLAVRLWHWLNLASLVVLLLSGPQILCSHPAFYWGEASRFARPFLQVGALAGVDGQPPPRAFPAWLTLPGELDLGAGRRWHFFFAWLFAVNGAVYLAAGLIGGRLRREMAPSREQMAHIGRAILDHARLRFPHGDEARRYNVLQKLTYLPVVLGLLPLMVLTGLAMSPTIDAAVPLLPTLLGGRQSARTLHFLSASGLVAFAAVHVAMVILAGPINEMRSMITGWFVIRPAVAKVEGDAS